MRLTLCLKNDQSVTFMKISCKLKNKIILHKCGAQTLAYLELGMDKYGTYFCSET